jgi:hypothetical protein
MTMDAEKLIETVALEIWKASAIDIMGTRDLDTEWEDFLPLDREPYFLKARAAVRIVAAECAAKAAIASLGTAKETADRIQRAIRSLSPDAEGK